MKELAIRLLRGKPVVHHPLWMKSRKWLPWVISIAAISYIVWRILQEDLSIWTTFWPPSPFMISVIALTMALMPVNWTLEALKWKTLISPWYPELTLRRAVDLVFCGISTGIFTPNRIGEYPGRIMGLQEGYRWEAATVMMVDRLFQLLLTGWTGGLSLLLVGSLLPAEYRVTSEMITWGFGGLIVLTLTMILGTKFIGDRLTWLPNTVNTALIAASPGKLTWIFFLSAIRNLVFTGQFLLLLYAFGLDIRIELALGLVWLIFLIKSVVPVWTVTELGIRESIAMFVLGLAGVSASVAFVPTFLLYLINLIVPALIGLRKIHRLSW